MEGKRVLHLTVKKQWFEVMVNGEKNFELRTKSDWIKSRLFNKDGTRRAYDLISITNGYGKDKPSFVADYLGFGTIYHFYHEYSNGSILNIDDEMYMIDIGHVHQINNYNN